MSKQTATECLTETIKSRILKRLKIHNGGLDTYQLSAMCEDLILPETAIRIFQRRRRRSKTHIPPEPNFTMQYVKGCRDVVGRRITDLNSCKLIQRIGHVPVPGKGRDISLWKLVKNE